MASTVEPSTWATYEEAVAAAKDADGVGFVFTEADPYVGVDLDDCLTAGGDLHPAAENIVSTLDGWTEWSPSKRGIHVIVKAKLNGGRHKTSDTPWDGAFEVYDRRRFFTTPGEGQGELVDRQAELEQVLARLLPPPPPVPRPVISPPVDINDHDVLEKAFAASNGASIRALYHGDKSEYDEDDSAADMALCSKLAFYCPNNPDQLDRLFRGSGLMREKWDSPRGQSTYGRETIEKALSGCTKFYEPDHRAKPRLGKCVITERAANVKQDEPALPLAEKLHAVEAFLRRYVALSEAQYIGTTLWAAHTHAIEATSTTPYLHVTSPEPECGKSRLFECLEAVTPSPLYAASMTPAVLFRAVEQLSPTLLLDEADNLLGDKEAKKELFAILNAGCRRGAVALRCGGNNRDRLDSFETFCPKAIAGLDDLVATLASRCLRIEMQRRRLDELVSDFFRDEAHAEAAPIRDGLAAWAANEQLIEQLKRARPERLGVRDRLEEALRLFVAIAEMAGARWHARARDALTELAGTSHEVGMSERTQLLVDIKAVFADRGNPDELASTDLLQGLIALDESPWRGWWAKEDNDGEVRVARGAAQKLSTRLKSFDIASRTIGPKELRKKGYLRGDFENAWGRYLPKDSPTPRVQVVHPVSAA
jgi:hypothetical protein